MAALCVLVSVTGIYDVAGVCYIIMYTSVPKLYNNNIQTAPYMCMWSGIH